MIDKQELVVQLLSERLANTKVGIIIKEIDGVFPEKIAQRLSEDSEEHLYMAAVGYDDISEKEVKGFTITSHVEKAVCWRSIPDHAGSIIVFIKNDTDKLHSLAEFETLSSRDLTRFLIELQIKSESNTPTLNFWKALQQTSDFYSYDIISEFVESVTACDKVSDAIPLNMWRLNLLRDTDILGTKNKPEERLEKNRELIFAIGQLSEDSRKKLSRSLVRTKGDDKDRLQKAYTELQNLYKYGKRETLRHLDYETVQELFSASKANDTRKKTNSSTQDGNSDENGNEPTESSPIRPKELGNIVSDTIVFGDEESLENVKELLREIKKHFDPETEENVDAIPTIGGIFNGRNIVIDNHQSDLRKLVGRVCNNTSWGGILETEETVLKDAVSADIKSFYKFDPTAVETPVSFKGGIDGDITLFDFIGQFDGKFDSKGIDTVERFKPIIASLLELRKSLLQNLDLIMYYPVLTFGVDEVIRKDMLDYLDAWAKLYSAFCKNEPIMREISAGSTSFIARALLLLDVLYVKNARKEYKGILLPLNPIYLWRYYEVFKMLPSQKGNLDEDDAKALTSVLTQLPQILSFVIANSLITDNGEDKILPCSGSIEMLPTFENKTNRYFGNDGTEALGEILSRWIGFAPYTRNEVRICSVDAPDLIENLRSIKKFMDSNLCHRVVYDVYLTRGQNGNTEFSKIDYSGRDYEIGEFIKKDRISISIKNVDSALEVKNELAKKPVHVAFYFDQSSYAIEFGPNTKNLYINPLVITYDYSFDEMKHRGSIYPSSEMDSGLIGDYHKMLRSADLINNNMNPRTTYSGSADMTAVVSTIEDGQTQWLVVADRDTNNYDPKGAIPIGEMQYEKRMVNVWTSSESRIISQYLTMLRSYNLYPEKETLINILKKFGHISSNGLISIPKFGADAQAIDNKKKGLLGTLFAASWYTKHYEKSLVASLDDDKARLWLHDSRYGNERADLVGLRYDLESNTLFIQPIEVKTRDESPDASIMKDEESGKMHITGHAPGQIAAVVGMLKDIFSSSDTASDMFISARREVLKYQIVSECFRSIHDCDWQKEWCDVLKRAFGNGKSENINIHVSGVLMYIKLSEATGGQVIQCINPEVDDCPIEFRQFTAKEIQEEILGEGTVIKEMWEPDFDETSESPAEEDVIVDSDTRDEEEHAPVVYDFTPDLSTSLIVAEPEGEYGTKVEQQTEEIMKMTSGVSLEEIEQLVRDFKRSCGDYHINLKECDAKNTVIGPSVIRLKFKLGRGQSLSGLSNHLEDIGREMKRSGVIIQSVLNSDELLLDVPRLQRDQVLFKNVIRKLPEVTSPEQLYFPLGRTPNGKDLIENLAEMPHMLVGGSTGSGKSVFLFTLLAALLMSHPKKEDMQLILSSSKLEDFVHFENLPHLYAGKIISDATEATEIIKDVIFKESERRGKLLVEARVANIVEYNKKAEEKLAPIVVVIDEFADLADQLESTKEKNAFYKPIRRIAQTGRSRGIHLIICTQRPEAKLVDSTTKSQLNGRVALRVNDSMSSRMILGDSESDAQYLQKHGDMIFKLGDIKERAQGYLIEIPEIDQIVQDIIG